MDYCAYSLPAVALLALCLSGCGKDDPSPPAAAEEETVSAAAAPPADQAQTTIETETAGNLEASPANNDDIAIPSPDDVPYPLYPNGLSYRVGAEGSLNVILFQTEDSFEQVDAFYQERSNLLRLSAMSGYVRYSASEDDTDPWETAKPGIVIHQFNDASEREAVGADDNAKTNIIMSFY